MRKQYHILNGDCLKKQFPNNIDGELIVARECLVDGNVEGKNLAELFQTRARFISQNYKGFKKEDYYRLTVPEFQKIINITKDSDIHLWFEDDLFCQVNLWFVLYLIYQHYNNQTVYLIRPNASCKYNFGGMNTEELETQYQTKTRIEPTELKELSKLWSLYQKDDCNQMLGIAQSLKDRFPFLIDAIQAHQDRLPVDGKTSRLAQSLLKIMKDLNTEDFEPVFIEFSTREGIYGLGDLQVKRLIDEIINYH